jgi:signal transduction histidine kinase
MSLAFESVAQSIQTKVIWSSVEYLANMGIPLFYLPFILSYNLGRSSWFKRHLPLFWIIPILTLALVATNHYHHLIWTGFTWSPDGNNILIYHHGPAFWVAMVYSLLLIMLGFMLLVRNIIRNPYGYRRKAWYLILGSLFPYTTAMLYLLHWTPLEGLNTAPMGIMLTGLIFFLGITREHLFDIIPAGRQLMIEKMSDGVLVLDGERAVMDANPAAFKSLKLEEDIQGRKLEEVLPSLIINQNEDKTDKTRLEVFVPDPIARWFDVNQYPLNEDREELGGSILILHDITHRKRTEDQLRKLAEELSNLNALKDKLYSIIAHDLRSPFNSILGFAELLSNSYDEFTDDQRRQFSNTISLASKSAFNLLENLLEWANVQLGHIKFNPAPVNLNAQTDTVFTLLALSAGNKNIQLVNRVLESIVVFADQNMLLAILRNLVSNGIKFTRNGGRVEVNARFEKGFHVITVSDDGVGMSEMQLSKLFQIDKLISTRGTSDEKGTGLGLILCHEFVIRHGGDLRVESKEGEGTRFIVTLPAK